MSAAIKGVTLMDADMRIDMMLPLAARFVRDGVLPLARPSDAQP